MPELWIAITENTNNREIAGFVWLLALTSLLLAKTEVRQSVTTVLRSVLKPRLWAVFVCFAGWVTLVAWIASQLGLWYSSHIIPTIIWYFFGGLPLLARAFSVEERSNHFRGYAKAVLSSTAFLEFIYVARTFSLPVELVLTPIIATLAMLVIVSERDPERAPVNAVVTWVLAAIAIAIFWNSISQILDAPKEFFSADTLRTFMLPIYLTIGSIPFFYALHCYSHIEKASIWINQKNFQTQALKRYAKKRFILVFLLRPWLLRRATQHFHRMPAREHKDVDAIIRNILQHERDKEAPPMVDEKHGWSPFLALEFLTEENLHPIDYHAGYENKWLADTVSRKLDTARRPSVVHYSISGVQGLAQKLTLQGRFIDGFFTKEALSEFSRVAKKLCTEALSDSSEDLSELICKRVDFERIKCGTSIQLKQERFPNEKAFELTLVLNRPQ